jgi:glycosyltransferase involved in cell wall biosynthesis
MKRVLIITYYWPPSGGAGVQRWLKFVKYFRQFGWESVVYTPENPEAPVIDNSLEKDIPENLEILKRPIWEPYTFYKKFIGQKKDQKVNAGFLSETAKPKLTENLSVWIRGNFFIPDARKFWIKPSIKFLTKYLKENPVDAIVTTGPPHSMHMIGLGLKKKLNLPWLADFRDPWTNIDFYGDLKLSGWADRKHHQKEFDILRNADEVSVISDGMAQDFEAIHKRKYQVVTNGFDEDDNPVMEIMPDAKFSVAHIGTMVKTRNPLALWKALSYLIEKDKLFKELFELKLVGKVDIDVRNSIREFGLEGFVKTIDYLPHDEVVTEQKKSSVLLLIINDTPNAKLILTGKFFEYLSSQRPILCIGPQDGDAAKIINNTNSGFVCEYHDSSEIREAISELFNDFEKGSSRFKSENIQKYSRKSTTARIAEILDGIITN